MSRSDDVLAARAAADEWAADHGLPPSGGYSGQWYVDEYLGGWWPDGWVKWWAAYGITPGSLIGGDVVAHQYTSDPIDMDVMLESEIVTQSGGDVTDEERQQMQNKIDGLVNSLGYIAGDLLAPVAKQKTLSVAVKKLVAGIRSQADEQGIHHV